MVEHRLCKAGVRGSSPLVSTSTLVVLRRAGTGIEDGTRVGDRTGDLALRWLAAHSTPGVDQVLGGSYRRRTAAGVLVLQPAAGGMRICVQLAPDRSRAPSAAELAQVRHVLDADRDLDPVHADLGRHAVLRPLLLANPGLRVIGGWSGWESLVRVVVGQQVSVAGARTLAGRVARLAGSPVPDAGSGLDRLFPTPNQLAAADLRAVGLTGARLRSLTGLAHAVASGELPAEPGEHPDGGPGWLADLGRRPGVGPWTLAYLAMRVLRDPDAWPAGDLVLRRACSAFGIDPAVAAVSFRPWRAYAATHLWEATPF